MAPNQALNLRKTYRLTFACNSFIIKINKTFKERIKMKATLKVVGTWWNDNSIDLVEIDGEPYALNGGNGEAYIDSWKCSGEYLDEASEESYSIRPKHAD